MLNEENVPSIRAALRRVSARLQAGSDELRDMYNALSLRPADRPEPGTIAANVSAAATKAREAIAMIAEIERVMGTGQAPRPRKRAA